MKKTRIVIGCIFAAVALGVDVAVLRAWWDLGVQEYSSLLLAASFYTFTAAAIWFTVDQTIQGK